MSEGHTSVSPPVQARAHKVTHVFQRILVCHRARHSARNAIHQHQDGTGRLLVTVFVPSEKQEVHLHLWVTWFRLASGHLPRAAIQMGNHFRNGKCYGSCCVTSSFVGSWSSLHSRRTEFAWQVELVSLPVQFSWQQGFSFCCRDA